MTFLSYLDPGSGSALVGTLIAVAGAALFSLKSFIYRLFGKEKTIVEVVPNIAIFSEGKNYWGTFKEIVGELITRKVHFAYYTLDLHDPALLIDSEYMHSRLFDKHSPASYQRLAKIESKVLLATTPNIGTPGYPLKRPIGVKTMVHVFHAFADISAYHVGSLDNYDVVLMVGPHQEKYIREVEAKRHLPAKKLKAVGLPYFDTLLHELGQSIECAAEAKVGVRRTILVAPSWGTKGLLTEYGTEFICQLAEAGYNVIVRPHPQSYIAEPEFINRCKTETAKYANIRWDAETVGTKAMRESDILISDTSSIRFDYAFLYGKPVVTLDIPREKQSAYEGQFMGEIWTDVAAPRLGHVINHDTLGTLTETVRNMLDTQSVSDGIADFRSATITNLGQSAQVIVDFLIKKSEG